METKHFIRTNENNHIIHRYSTEHEETQAGDIEINVGMHPGRDVCFFVNGEWRTNPPVTNGDGVYLYNWSGTEILERTPQEIEADTPEPPELPDPPPEPGHQFTPEDAEFLTEFIKGYKEGETDE